MHSICCNSSVKSWRKIRKDADRRTQIKLFINKYKWEGLNLRSEKDDWEKFEKNNVTINVNALYGEK